MNKTVMEPYRGSAKEISFRSAKVNTTLGKPPRRMVSRSNSQGALSRAIKGEKAKNYEEPTVCFVSKVMNTTRNTSASKSSTLLKKLKHVQLAGSREFLGKPA
jgi:hypothetical protein